MHKTRGFKINNKIYFYILQSLNIILSLYLPINTKNIIDSIIQASNQMFIINSISFIIIIILFIVTLSASNYMKIRYEEFRLEIYRKKLYYYIGYEDLENLQDKNIGYFLSRYNDDFEKMRPFILDIPFKRVSNGIVIFIIFILLIKSSVSFTIIMFAVFPLFLLIKSKMTKKIKILNSEIQSDKEILNTGLEEFVKYNYTIKTSGSVESIIKKNENSLYKYVQNILRLLNVNIVYDYFLATGLLNMISIIVYIYGGILALQGEITIGTLTMFSMYYSKLWNPLEFYISYPKFKAEYEVSYNRVVGILKFKKHEHQLNITEGFHGLALNNVHIHYEDKLILENINFKINKGDKIGLIGGNGSGKSSLANILAGIKKSYSGAVYLNKIELKSLNLEDITKMIKLIPSKPDIFFGTVSQNISMFMDNKVDENNPLIKILKDNGVNLDTMIGGSLDNLSGGEQKIIQLLRGFNTKMDLYIIDEPLNYIDYKHKNTIIKYLEEETKDKTVVIISHDDDIFQLTNKFFEIKNKGILEVKK